MIWSSFVILVGTIVLLATSLRSSRGDALGLPLVAIGSFIFLYVVEPLRIIQTGAVDAFLTEWQTAKAILIPAVMLAAFVCGWLQGGQVRPRRRRDLCWNGQQMWNFGLFAALSGLALYTIFLERSGGFMRSFSQPHGRAMDYESNTAYLYYGPWWVISGSVMMILGASKFRASRWKQSVPFVFLAVLLTDAVLTGSRGILFGAIASFLISYSLAHETIVSMTRAIGLLLALGCGVLSMLAFRSALYLGEGKPGTLPDLAEVMDTISGISEYDTTHGTAGQEFVYHAALLDTVDRTGKLDYGVSWVTFLVINPIPKLLWPDKHYFDSPGITWNEIYENSNVTIATGSAPGIVADLYAKFGIFAALFLYGFGRLTRNLFSSARCLDSPMTTCGYVMLYAVSLNMFAQGFGAIFVPFGYSMMPVLLFTWGAGRRRTTSAIRLSDRKPNVYGEPCL